MTTSKKAAEKQPPKVKCEDCGAEYLASAPHAMFCPAHTCSECGTSFGNVLPIYDSSPEAQDEDGNPMRLCDECLFELDEGEGDEGGGEEDDSEDEE